MRIVREYSCALLSGETVLLSGCRLPDALVKSLKLKAGDEIEIVVTGERTFQVLRAKSRELVLAQLRALKKPLPKGFRFDREEANGRYVNPLPNEMHSTVRIK